ncbi:10948_t:CDS:2 [Entrophospora sp. SA101]|nr:10948_t:CDS:2 [Entrophospora sp. SA101]
MALSSKKKLFSLFTPPPMSPILSPIGINSNGTMISNYFPTIETLEDRQLQQPTLEDIRKAGENFERLVAAAEAYRDLTIKIGKASKTLSKALKDYGNSKGMDNIHVMCLQTSSQFYEQNSENKVLQKDFDSLQKVSEKYFKKTTKEEKLHNEHLNELDKQVKKIGKDYEKKSKKDSKSSLESHDKYISSLTTVGSDIARARAEYMNQAIRRERSTHCVISQIICKIAEGNFAYFNDSLKKCGPFISKMKEWVPFAGEDMPQPLDLDSFLEDQALRSDDNSINSDKTLPEPYPNISEKKSSSTPNLLNYINNNSQLSFYSSPNSLPPLPQFTVEPNDIEVPKYTQTPEEIQKPLLPIESTTKKDSTSTKHQKNESVKLNNFNSTVTADVGVGVKSTFEKDSPKLNSENKTSIIDNSNKSKTPIISKKISDDEYLIVSKKTLGYNQAIISHENIQTSQPPQKMPTKDEYQIIDADKHLIMQQKLRNSPPSNNLLEKYEGCNDEAIQEIYHSKSLHYTNHKINNANNNIDDPDVIYSDYQQQQKNYNFTSNEIFNNDNDYESNHHDNYNNMLSYMPKSFTSRERSTPRDDYEVYTARKSYSTTPLPINKRGNSVADIKERFMTKHNSIDSNRSSSPPIRDLPRSISGRVNDIKSKLGDERNRSMNPSYLQLPKSNRGGDYHRNNMSYNDINNNNFYSDDLQDVDEHFINNSEEILTSGGNHHL